MVKSRKNAWYSDIILLFSGLEEEPAFECPVSDDRYEIIGDNCFHFFIASKKSYQDAQTYCATVFPKSKGKMYEPRSLSHLELIKKVWKRRRSVPPYNGNNCFFLGIDDTLNEGTYIYPSDGTMVDSNIKSKIYQSNRCNQTGLTTNSAYDGSEDCDYVYACESSPRIRTTRTERAFLCEHVTE